VVRLEVILADNAIELRLTANVQQKPSLQIRRAQIAEQLPPGVGMESFSGFDLYERAGRAR